MRAVPAIILFALVASLAHADSWRSYRNDRFGTTADTPASWRMGEAPANDDGRIFTSPDGRAQLIVSGIHAIDPRAAEFAARLQPNAGETIDYRRAGRDWLVVSGRKGAQIFYRKSVLSCGGAIWNSVSLEYPAAEKADYDKLVGHVAASLRPGPGYGNEKCR